jgi:RimJ/RimL family protein N-acetyltransferase
MRIIENDLIIRAAEPNDAHLLTNWWNDGRIMAHAGFPNGLNQSVEQTLVQINQNHHGPSKRCILEVKDNPIG